MLQVSDAQAVKVSERGEYLLSMQQQVDEYVKNGVPEDAKTFLQRIKQTLRDDVLPELVDEKILQESTHDPLEAAVTAAETKYTETTYNEEPVTTAKSEHSQCRDAEHDKWNITQTCDTEEGTAQSDYDGKESAVKIASSASGVCIDNENYDWRNSGSLESYKTNAGAYEAAIAQLISSRGTLEAKIQDCETKDGHLATQLGTCNTKQSTYESAACTYARAHKSAADTYTTEYDDAQSAFDGFKSTWSDSSANREHQCETIKKLICYLEALEENDDEAALRGATGECDKPIYDCSEMSFTMSATPAKIATTAIPDVCGDDGFEYFEGGAAPPQGTALVTGCTCDLS